MVTARLPDSAVAASAGTEMGLGSIALRRAGGSSCTQSM